MKSKNRKCEEGALRNAEWRTFTPAQQLASLDRRLGKGVGAIRQREKLTGTPLPLPTLHEVKMTVASKAEGRRRDAHKKAKAK